MSHASAARPADDAKIDRGVGRLLRLHNVQLLLVVLVGLACVAIVKTTKIYSERPAFLGWLTWLRVILPAVALLGIAWITNAALKRLRRLGEAPDASAHALDAALNAFDRSKRVAQWLLTGVALLAAGSLLFGHRRIDLALAVASLALLWIARPSRRGFEQFAALAAAGQ